MTLEHTPKFRMSADMSCPTTPTCSIDGLASRTGFQLKHDLTEHEEDYARLERWFGPVIRKAAFVRVLQKSMYL